MFEFLLLLIILLSITSFLLVKELRLLKNELLNYKTKLNLLESGIDDVLKFSIGTILNQAIEKEDFETATRCQKILK